MPTLIIRHVDVYKRQYRKRLNLWGTPIRIEFRGGENPFQPAGGRPKRPKSGGRRKTGK